jgi:hypothetical protein
MKDLRGVWLSVAGAAPLRVSRVRFLQRGALFGAQRGRSESIEGSNCVTGRKIRTLETRKGAAPIFTSLSKHRVRESGDAQSRRAQQIRAFLCEE